ncbi:Anaphase-promoting complex subunit 11 [Cardamine amara subsp. amara]|uniref:Anaphase-promoting complex subunit 11 n=1 Tax=Cardamine amara subsp. amara TaxID=228776 RepID=A0ABD1B349_CARAN
MYYMKSQFQHPNSYSVKNCRHGVASWTRDAQDKICGICQMPYVACCPDCKLSGDDCPPRKFLSLHVSTECDGLMKTLLRFLCYFKVGNKKKNPDDLCFNAWIVMVTGQFGELATILSPPLYIEVGKFTDYPIVLCAKENENSKSN